ncbi:hypothetical protein CAOG_010084 [Capsaspora owczarzaki ATCC 30864]|uniref:Uncharacterized protein n=1 Tax=Capsaspora owczarzaki (strain ATCC 30864) TaxID=595528 RepID=A0A0D2VZA9_CAPO3|nr:hypothetical protein CAOG_010084 [Capsaspora owczarzaki ATCC 30864]
MNGSHKARLRSTHPKTCARNKLRTLVSLAVFVKHRKLPARALEVGEEFILVGIGRQATTRKGRGCQVGLVQEGRIVGCVAAIAQPLASKLSVLVSGSSSVMRLLELRRLEARRGRVQASLLCVHLRLC